MFMKETQTGNLVKVLAAEELFDPMKNAVQACQQAGQGEQPPSQFEKSQLVFPSGEPLPQCWIDPDYQVH